jgi:hypothetical protein
LLAACIAGSCGVGGAAIGGYFAFEAARKDPQSSTSEPVWPTTVPMPIGTVVGTQAALVSRTPGDGPADLIKTKFRGDRVLVSCVQPAGGLHEDQAGRRSTSWAQIQMPMDGSGWIPTHYLEMSAPVRLC